MTHEIAEALVAHVGLQIEQAVLNRPAPFDRLALIMRRGDRVSDIPGDRQRPKVTDAVGKIAKALAELERRREGRRPLRDCLAARAADLPIEPGGEDELVRRVAVDLESRRNL